MKHRFKSIGGAVRRVRELEQMRIADRRFIDRLDKERRMLARLAAKGAAFFNPLEAMAAERLRDGLLKDMGLNPDGSIIPKPQEPA